MAELQQAAERDPPSGLAPAVPTPLAGNKPEPVRSPSEGRAAERRGRGAGTRGGDAGPEQQLFPLAQRQWQQLFRGCLPE